MNNFTFLKVYNSPFKPFIPKLYIGRMTIGVPYPKKGKKGYGTATSYGLGVLNKIIEQGNGQIELMEDADDWINVV